MPELARHSTAEGVRLVLSETAGVYSLRVNGLELMSSRGHRSEDALARVACEGLGRRPSPRVLVGGLGFGYTLRATLDNTPENSRIVVCELFESLLEWNRTHLADLAGRPLDDPRVEAVRADVWDVLDPGSPFDAILLDVDNGPRALSLPSNARLYRDDGLARLAESLAPAGRLAVWSADSAPEFEKRLRQNGFSVTTERVGAHGGSEVRHTLFAAVRG